MYVNRWFWAPSVTKTGKNLTDGIEGEKKTLKVDTVSHSVSGPSHNLLRSAVVTCSAEQCQTWLVPVPAYNYTTKEDE